MLAQKPIVNRPNACVAVLATIMMLLALLPATPEVVADKATAPTPLVDREDVRDSVLRGLAWLSTKQRADGSWEESCGVTGLILITYEAAGYDYTNQTVSKGLAYLRTWYNETTGVMASSLLTYETAISLMAILGANDPQDAVKLEKVTNALVGIQWTDAELNESVKKYAGGWPNNAGISDMSNSQFAMLGLMTARLLNPSVAIPASVYEDMAKFAGNCQNWPAVNTMPWAHNASLPSYGDGGFVYNVLRSRTPLGEQMFESYGSITAAGLFVLLLAGHDYTSPRTMAARDWLEKEYTLSENPRVEGKGLYYYLWSMARAFALSPQDRVVDSAGNVRDWRSEIANAFMSIQRTDGGWDGNPFTGWREEEPELASMYALFTMEAAYLMVPNPKFDLEVIGATSAVFIDLEGAKLVTDAAKGLTVTPTKLTATDPEVFRKVWVDITGTDGSTATVSAKGTWGQGREAVTSAQVRLGADGARVLSATGGFAGPFGIHLQPYAGGPQLKTSAGKTLYLKRGEVNIIDLKLTETTGTANVSGVDVVLSLASNATVDVNDQHITVPKGGSTTVRLTIFVPEGAPEGDAGYMVVSSNVAPPVRVAVRFGEPEDDGGAPSLYWVLILVLFVVVMALIALPAMGRRRTKEGGDKPRE